MSEIGHKILEWAQRNLAFRGSDDEEYKFDCPFCGRELKLWFNARKNRFICYRCGMGGTGITLVAEYEDITYASARRMFNAADDDHVRYPHLIAEMFEEFRNNQATEMADPDYLQHLEVEGLMWHGQTPPYEAALDTAIESAQEIIDRGFDPDLFLGMRAGYFVTGKYRERTCLPVYVGGAFVYFQAWDHGKRFNPKLKYLNPSNKDVPLSKSQFLYNYDRWEQADTVVVVEGVFNAWAVEQAGYPAISCFGKSISLAQFGLLLQHPARQIILGFDPDARSESAAVCRAFLGHGKRAILARTPVEKDWNDLSVGDRQRVLASASEPDWLWE